MEELRTAAPEFLEPLYIENAKFDGPVYRNARLITLLLERGTSRGYFPELANSLFVCDSPTQEETAKQVREAEGLRVNVVPGIRCFVAYVSPVEDRDAWVLT